MCVCVGSRGRGGGTSTSSPFPPPLHCAGRTRRAKLILACMESCKGTSAAPDLPITSFEGSKVYDRV